MGRASKPKGQPIMYELINAAYNATMLHGDTGKADRRVLALMDAPDADAGLIAFGVVAALADWAGIGIEDLPDDLIERTAARLEGRDPRPVTMALNDAVIAKLVWAGVIQPADCPVKQGEHGTDKRKDS